MNRVPSGQQARTRKVSEEMMSDTVVTLPILKEIYAGMAEFIEAGEQLLAWCPICSEGSSGFKAQQKLRAAIERLRGVLA